MTFGIILCLISAAAATLLASIQHVVGAPMIGLILGILACNLIPEPTVSKGASGYAFCSKRLLRLGIILAGGTLDFSSILKAGISALPLIVAAILISFLSAWVYGKKMGSTENTRLLVGGGTSICGGTAIATLSAVIDAKEDETAYAMTSIFLWDILAALIWPYAAMAMHFTPEQYGLLGGVAINDVSSVTAAGDTFNALMGASAVGVSGLTGGDAAMVVKLTRVSMLIFVAMAMTAYHQMRLRRLTGHGAGGEKGSTAANLFRAFPIYVLGFLALAVLNTVFDFKSIYIGGASFGGLFSPVYKFLFAMALAGVGAKIKIKELLTKSIKPILLGGLTWATVAAVTVLYALVFG